jgi:guanylate kinase
MKDVDSESAYDDIMVVNDDCEQAFEELEAMIYGAVELFNNA